MTRVALNDREKAEEGENQPDYHECLPRQEGGVVEIHPRGRVGDAALLGVERLEDSAGIEFVEAAVGLVGGGIGLSRDNLAVLPGSFAADDPVAGAEQNQCEPEDDAPVAINVGEFHGSVFRLRP